MQRRFRSFYTALREHSSVSYAKIATVGGFCNVERLIIKATAPHDLPLPEKYIQELLKIFSLSPSSLRQFSLSFTRRFGKTHCWRVALKCLILLHRLLRAVPEDSNFRIELLWMRSNGVMTLNQCHFRDDSSSASQDYTAFIRSYAQLLDEALHCFWLDNHPTCNHQQHQQDQELQLEQEDQQSEEYEDEQEEHQELEEPQFESLSNRMTDVGRILEVLPQLQSLIDLMMDCRPTGPADKAYLVQLAMKQIIRDSFMCYTIFRREIVLVLDSLFQMPYRSCISAFGVYKKAAVQANQLCEFYEWCKAMGFCGYYEYPFIDQIPQIQIHALENFLNGMWQMTDQSSSTPTSPTSSASTPSSFVEYSSSTEDDVGEGLIEGKKDHVLVSTKWEKSLIQFEGGYWDEEKPLIQLDYDDLDKPLIQFEDDDVDESWESLLEASIDMPHVAPQQLDLLYSGSYGHFDYPNEVQYQGQKDRWEMQVYDSGIALNPFYQPAIMTDYNICYAQY